MAAIIVLETRRLVLRRQVDEDLDDLWALYRDPEITRYIPDAPTSREEAKEELEWHRNGHPEDHRLGLWATIEKETGRFVGRCGLIPWTLEGREEVEVAYAIARDSWGRGFATEAARAIRDHGFGALGRERLIALIDPGNRAAQRIAEKIGMNFERRVEEYEGDGTPFFVYSARRRPTMEPDEGVKTATEP